MPLKPSIAAPTAQNIEQLEKLHLACLDKHWNKEELKKLLGAEGTYCLLSHAEDASATGFILYRCIAGEGEIINMGVIPSYQKQGIGKALLSEAIHRCKEKKASDLWLEVAENNTAALALYNSAGFIKKGRRKEYYETPEGRVDALTLSLTLA